MASIYRMFRTTLPVWASHVRRKGWYFLCDDPSAYGAFSNDGKLMGKYYPARCGGWVYEGERE